LSLVQNERQRADERPFGQGDLSVRNDQGMLWRECELDGIVGVDSTSRKPALFGRELLTNAEEFGRGGRPS
jgi:hypothetical protein